MSTALTMEKLNGISSLYREIGFDLTDPRIVILAVDGKEFPVHKAILDSHSPIFSVMSRQDLKYRIMDCSADACEALLRFLYTGSLPANSLANYGLDLLSVAAKVSVQFCFY